MTDNLHDVIIGFQAETIQMERKLLKATKDVDKAAKSFERGGDAGQKMFDRIERSMSPTLSKMRDVRKELDRMEKDFGDAALGMEKYQQGLRIIDNLQMKAEKSGSQLAALMSTRGLNSSRAMGTAIQQAGYQVGDFAVQVASGQSAMVAFTQQGTQLISMFGPKGAVAGAVLAIGGAIYQAFSAMGESTDDVKEATDRYTEALSALKDMQEEVVRLEKERTGIYEGQRVEQIKSALDEAQNRVQELAKSGEGSAGLIDVVFGTESELQAAERQVRELTKALLEARDASKQISAEQQMKEADEFIARNAEERSRREQAAEDARAAEGLRKVIEMRKKRLKVEQEYLDKKQKQRQQYEANMRKFDQAIITQQLEWEENQREEAAKREEKRLKEHEKLMRQQRKEIEKAEKEHMKRMEQYSDALFGNMGDALSEFVSTGKMDFKSLADSIVSDMMRIMIQQQVTGPLASLGSSLLSSAVSSFFPLDGTSISHWDTANLNTAPPGIGPIGRAAGGIVTGPGTATSDSIPTMLSNGEFVINAAQTKKFLPLLEAINSGRVQSRAAGGMIGSVPSGAAMGGGTIVNVIDQRSGDKAPVEAQETRGPNGKRQISIMIRDTVRRGITNGEYDGALNGRFGSQPATIRRG